jgi:hypothetical protein
MLKLRSTALSSCAWAAEPRASDATAAASESLSAFIWFYPLVIDEPEPPFAIKGLPATLTLTELAKRPFDRFARS